MVRVGALTRHRPERRFGRFVIAAMIGPYTLPTLGGALLAAVALGVHLGESAIGLINPIHFQGPALHPRDRGAAIDESRVTPRPPAYSGLYGWEEGAVARAADCGDCEALRARAAYARDYSAEIPYYGGPAEVVVADAGAGDAGVEPVLVYEAAAEAEAVTQAAPVKPPVARYAYYPVTADEAAEPAEEPPPDEHYRP